MMTSSQANHRARSCSRALIVVAFLLTAGLNVAQAQQKPDSGTVLGSQLLFDITIGGFVRFSDKLDGKIKTLPGGGIRVGASRHFYDLQFEYARVGAQFDVPEVVRNYHDYGTRWTGRFTAGPVAPRGERHARWYLGAGLSTTRYEVQNDQLKNGTAGSAILGVKWDASNPNWAYAITELQAPLASGYEHVALNIGLTVSMDGLMQALLRPVKP